MQSSLNKVVSNRAYKDSLFTQYLCTKHLVRVTVLFRISQLHNYSYLYFIRALFIFLALHLAQPALLTEPCNIQVCFTYSRVVNNACMY